MKQLDAKNVTARKKAKDQPYYKVVLDYLLACPYCDALLDFEKKCKCGYWSFRWTEPGFIYTKTEDIAPMLEGGDDE